MTIIISIIISTLLLCITLLIYKIFTLSKENIVKEIKKDSIIFSIPVDSCPKYSDSDPDMSLLKDMLYSMKSENWPMEFKFDHMVNDTYDISFLNGSGTIKLEARIRVYSYSTSTDIYLSWFNIKKIKSGQMCMVTFDNSDIIERSIVLTYMWEHILDYHRNKRDNKIKQYLDCKNIISKELKSLNRDRKLDDILEL